MTETTHDGQPARYRVRYADGTPISGYGQDHLFASLADAEAFVVDAEMQAINAGNPSQFEIIPV